MLTYLPALVNASTNLLAALADDPSAWGVATAFLALVPTLEAAFVPWCGAVGQWFTESLIPVNVERLKKEKVTREKTKVPASTPTTPAGTLPSRRKARSKSRPRGSLELNSGADGPVEFPTRKGLSSITPFVNNGASPTVVPSPSSAAKVSRSQTTWRRSGITPSTSTTTLGAEIRESEEPLRERVDSFVVTSGKVPPVRELAIQPTQRVMRYVLHYRGATSADCPGSRND
jgi:hypothetical protein